MDLRYRSAEHNPSPEQLRAYTDAQPTATTTQYGNVNISATVTARSKNSTFIVADDPSRHTDATITRGEYQRIAELQDRHFADVDVVVLDGYIGDHPDARVATRLVVDKRNANLAAMQQLLYFPPDDRFEPEFHVLYTPHLAAPGYPDDRIIAVDLDGGVTRVLNSDYFGESKMGGLRMWDALMYRRGGLAMHSGLKVANLDGEAAGSKAALVVGLSGTGKTTTTFSRTDVDHPVQDDFVALFPGGRVYGTEAGTYAKTYGLTEDREPAIWAGILAPDSYLENVGMGPGGQVDFFDRTHTENGRAVISARHIPGFKPPAEVERADFMLVLNRNANIIPAVARLSPDQAAAYFMLGETQGTSAGGRAEAGKFLRVPGTNPFFAYRHEWQANRLHEILQTTDLDVYLLNTGRVGGPEGDERSKKVTPAQSAAIVAGIAAGTVGWTADPDFGYEVAASVPGVDDAEVLQPRRLYERQGRTDEYKRLADDLTAERRRHLAGYPDLLPEIARAV